MLRGATGPLPTSWEVLRIAQSAPLESPVSMRRAWILAFRASIDCHAVFCSTIWRFVTLFSPLSARYLACATTDALNARRYLDCRALAEGTFAFARAMPR